MSRNILLSELVDDDDMEWDDVDLLDQLQAAEDTAIRSTNPKQQELHENKHKKVVRLQSLEIQHDLRENGILNCSQDFSLQVGLTPQFDTIELGDAWYAMLREYGDEYHSATKISEINSKLSGKSGKLSRLFGCVKLLNPNPQNSFNKSYNLTISDGTDELLIYVHSEISEEEIFSWNPGTCLALSNISVMMWDRECAILTRRNLEKVYLAESSGSKATQIETISLTQFRKIAQQSSDSIEETQTGSDEDRFSQLSNHAKVKKMEDLDEFSDDNDDDIDIKTIENIEKNYTQKNHTQATQVNQTKTQPTLPTCTSSFNPEELLHGLDMTQFDEELDF